MSWSEVFPVLTDDMVDAFVAGVSKKDRRELDAWFAVKRVINARPAAAHVVSTSLFWKNIREGMPEIVISAREQVLKPNKKGLLRFDPWSHYVEPVLKGAYWLGKHRPEAIFRVYLAADMEFLVPDLMDAGCEIYLMKSNSLAHNPGAMWRFLAFEGEAGGTGLVTVVDADRAAKPGPEMDQTVEMARLGLGWWRVPVWGELNEIGNVSYRPILGCHFGGNQLLPMRLLMQALVWNTNRGKIDPMAKLPGCPPARVHGSVWPDYGFDEWFLQTAVYPRAAFEGVLSFIPAEAKSRLLPLDIEYVQWANPKSEIVYFGTSGKGCCGGGNCDTAVPTPGLEVKEIAMEVDVIAYIYKPETGLGEAAAANLNAMRELGLTVRQHFWNLGMELEPACANPKQIVYHHWHPGHSERGKKWAKAPFGKAHHIGYWAYESDAMPEEFASLAPRMKELWVPSTYCQKIFSTTGKPTHVVPHAVAVTPGKLYPLPSQVAGKKAPFTVLFLFDAWSREARKNPAAVIRVFKAAFPPGSNARLLIKAHHLSTEEFTTLQKQCGLDHWITILNEYLPATSLQQVYESADVLLSLQRCEGFGFNLAKALAKGIPLVTTGYGGHLDFCKKAETGLVPFRLEDAASHQDPWYAGGRWAAPREDKAVEMLLALAAEIRRRDTAVDLRRQKARDRVERHFSHACLKERIRERLEGLFAPGRLSR